MGQKTICLITILLVSVSVAQGFFRTGPYFGKRSSEKQTTKNAFPEKPSKDMEFLKELELLERQPATGVSRSRDALLEAIRKMSAKNYAIDQSRDRKKRHQRQKQYRPYFN